MSKRKRSDDVEGDDATASANNFRQQRRVMAAFEESAKHLTKAFKLAKGLEQQKMGRRLKAAAVKKDQKDMDRITAEKTAIKALENALCAQHYLAKSILKIKAIATSPDLPVELSKPVAFPHDTASLNVNGRLCKSNPVQEAFPAAVAGVKKEFGIRDNSDGPAKKKKRLRAKDYEADRTTSVGSEDTKLAVKPLKKSKRAAESGDSDALSDANFGDSDEEDEFEQYQNRLASSDDEDDGDEDVEASDIEDLERHLAQEGLSRQQASSKKQRYDPAADLSLSEEESEDESIDERPPKKGAAAKPNKSSFIPSLTMGGYISGSGSDLDDDVDVAPKKNRRGQRARQKIWEQKYKAQANHLKNQERSAGWDPKRGAVGGSQPRFAKGANSMPLQNSRRNVGESVAKKPPKKDDSGPLHPSWEAAKRAKEKNSAPVPFQGKKISFD